MKRRLFLEYGLGASAFVLGTSKLWAMPMQHGMTHDQHAMQGMMEHSAHGHSSNHLMPIEKMPAGQALNPLAIATNQSNSANLVKVSIEAKAQQVTLADRKPTQLWLYNGQVPGPQIVAYEGDTVEVLFTNNLSQPTTLHWHGLPVPPDQDGHPMDPVLPGQSKLYRFTLPSDCAGTYWYHPHPHNLVSEQVAKGLAGSFIVKSKTDPLAHLPEQHWLISDLRLDAQGQVPANTMQDWMNGREGQFVLINGQRQPVISLQGNERIRIWNACAARYLRLHIPDCQFVVLATDGGLLEQALPAQDEILLAPAERLEVIVISPKQGNYALLNRYYDRQKMMQQEAPEDITLATIKHQHTASVQLPKQLRRISPLGAATAEKYIEFSEVMDHSQGMGMQHLQQMFRVNGQVFDMQRIDQVSRHGEVELWTVFNNSHMDHPFHLHGAQFQIISRQIKGQPLKTQDYVAWKDTFNLQPYETVVFKVLHKDVGMRMYHCHILEHETLGMMANLQVI